MTTGVDQLLSDADIHLLTHASLPHLKLLHAVDCFPGSGGLYDGHGAAHAADRYQNLWLPLLALAAAEGADLDRLIPPVDIAFAWHVHRLNPVAYEADCQHAIGQVIRLSEHQAFRFTDGTDSQSRYVQKYWKKKRTAGTFFPTQGDLVRPAAASSVKGTAGFANIDLPASMKCQAALLKNLLQPAVVEKTKEMIARYELFLQFRKRFPDVFAVPPVDVDFIWHTHMSMNARYHDMCMQHFGGDLRRVSHETVSPEDSAKSLKRDTGFGSTQSAWAEAFPESPYNAPWWRYSTPKQHPFLKFVEHLNINLEVLYGDARGQRAGSHALHALALLLELRKKFSGSDDCCYSCCIAPDRNAVRGLPQSLLNDFGKKYGRLPLCSTNNYLHVLDMAKSGEISLAGPSPDVFAAVTDVTSKADVTKKSSRSRPAPLNPQFSPYTSGPGNLYVVAALGSGACGNVAGCGGRAGGGCGGGGAGAFGGGGCGGGGGGGGGGGCGGGGGGGC